MRDYGFCQRDDAQIDGLRFEYQVSIPFRTVIIRAAYLLNETTATRYTNMRACELIVDAWVTASGDSAQPPPQS